MAAIGDKARYDIPVVMFVFRRLETVRMIVDKVREAAPAKIYVFADGPREDVAGEAELTEGVRAFIREAIDWDCEKELHFSERNKGCDKSIRDGLDLVFSREEMAVMLEDDAVPTPEYFLFCRELLLKYRDNKKVQFIAGYNAIGSKQIIRDDYTFGKTCPMNGAIAIWADRWNNCDFDLKDWPENKRQDRFHDVFFKRELRKRYYHLFDLVYDKTVTAWDYMIVHDLLNRDRFAAVPKVNLVTSYGYWEGAFHPQRKDETVRYVAMMTAPEKIEICPVRNHPELKRDIAYDRERQRQLLNIRGSFWKRRFLDCMLAVKDFLYAHLPKSVWNKLKALLKHK